MLPVLWNDDALNDLAEIIVYISVRNPFAAQRVKTAIETTGEKIGLHPMTYRSGRVAGTRECVVTPNYILIFRVERDAIRIVNVQHASRQYP